MHGANSSQSQKAIFWMRRTFTIKVYVFSSGIFTSATFALHVAWQLCIITLKGPMRLGDNLRDTKPPPSLRQWAALLFHSLDWGSMMLVGCSIHCHDSGVEEVQGVQRTKGSHWPRSFQSGDPRPFWPDHLVLAVQARSRSVSWYGETKGPR